MGITLPKPVMSKVLERHGNEHFRVGSSSINGFRESMEDAHITWMQGSTGFFGVFDGHVNDKCSEYLRRAWMARLPTLGVPMSDERMKEAALSIDKEWLDGGQEGGSTGTFFAAHKTSDKVTHLQVGNVGDSRVLVCIGGQCRPMTDDHKPMNDGEYRRIVQYGGRVENNRVDGSLAISRAFGDRDYKQNAGGQLEQRVIALADITHVDVSGDDFAVLCCDGVFESKFTNEEVIDFIKVHLAQCNDLAIVAGKVCEEAVARGSRDNISCVIVQFCNGMDYKDRPIELIPGPFNAPKNVSFRRMYQVMAKRANIDVSVALEMRYNELLQIQNPSQEIQEELEVFRPGPPADATKEQQAKWFADFWEEINRERNSQSRADQMQRFQMLQQQVGVPLPMLLSLMTGDESAN